MPAFDPEETLAASLADDRFAAKTVIQRRKDRALAGSPTGANLGTSGWSKLG